MREPDRDPGRPLPLRRRPGGREGRVGCKRGGHRTAGRGRGSPRRRAAHRPRSDGDPARLPGHPRALDLAILGARVPRPLRHRRSRPLGLRHAGDPGCRGLPLGQPPGDLGPRGLLGPGPPVDLRAHGPEDAGRYQGAQTNRRRRQLDTPLGTRRRPVRLRRAAGQRQGPGRLRLRLQRPADGHLRRGAVRRPVSPGHHAVGRTRLRDRDGQADGDQRGRIARRGRFTLPRPDRGAAHDPPVPAQADEVRIADRDDRRAWRTSRAV